MGYEGKVFKAGNSAAVRLPKRFGFTPGMSITLEQDGDKVTIAPRQNPDDLRRRLEAASDAITAIWAERGGPPPPMERDSDIFH